MFNIDFIPACFPCNRYLDHSGWLVIQGFSVFWHPGRHAAKHHVWSGSRDSRYNGNPPPLDPQRMTLREALSRYGPQHLTVYGPRPFREAAEDLIPF